MTRRLDGRLPRRGSERHRGPALVALVVHVVAVVLIGRMISVPVLDFLRRTGQPPVEERIAFVEPPREEAPRAAVPPAARSAPPTTRAAAPTDGRPALPVITAVPTGIDTAGAGSAAVAGATAPPTGRVAFGTGVAGLTTGPVDPRLVTPPPRPDAVVRAPVRAPELYVDAWVGAFWDSVAKAQQASGRRPGDWTTERNGDKYGMDQQFIYFGKFKLPTVLLALLPINAQANPGMTERNRVLRSMLAEIDFHAQRAANEAEFRQAVEELRARRERERQAKQDPPSSPRRGGVIPPEHE
jgi:hypothetical protein